MNKKELLADRRVMSKLDWAISVLKMRDIVLVKFDIEDNSAVMYLANDKDIKRNISVLNVDNCLALIETMVYYLLNNAGTFVVKVDNLQVVYRIDRTKRKLYALFPDVPVVKNNVFVFTMEDGFGELPYAATLMRTTVAEPSEYKQIHHILSDVIYTDTALTIKTKVMPNHLEKVWDYFKESKVTG